MVSCLHTTPGLDDSGIPEDTSVQGSSMSSTPHPLGSRPGSQAAALAQPCSVTTALAPPTEVSKYWLLRAPSRRSAQRRRAVPQCHCTTCSAQVQHHSLSHVNENVTMPGMPPSLAILTQQFSILQSQFVFLEMLSPKQTALLVRN